MAKIKKNPPTYRPFAPKIFQELLETYEKAMTCKDLDLQLIWCEKANTLITALINLKKDGFVPPLLATGFHGDIMEVKKIVFEKMTRGNLSQHQASLTFAMSNLDSTYRPKNN